MQRVLIVNAVPINNGDAALVFGFLEALKQKGYDVAVATHHYNIVRSYYPDIKPVRDILDYPLVKMSRVFKYFFIPILVLFLKPYREADVIVGAPGGYINSYYGIFDKLYVLFVCKLLGKKTAIYSQSIGPLTQKDAKIFTFFAKYLDLLYARDQMSYDTAVSLLGQDRKIYLTEDAVFLLNPDFSYRRKGKKVAVSVRDWAFDNREPQGYYSLVAELVRSCIRKGYDIEFLSTCQGVPGYIDDSEVAENIVNEHLQGEKRITIRRGRYALNEFRDILREYDFIIGTRLHMCILGMLNGIPAFNISYEVKGKECYAYLGIPEFSIDYNAERDTASAAFQGFISNLPDREGYLKDRIAASHSEAVRLFEHFCGVLEK